MAILSKACKPGSNRINKPGNKPGESHNSLKLRFTGK